jgi:hypothetical protein
VRRTTLALVVCCALAVTPFAQADRGNATHQHHPTIIAGKISTFGPPGEGAGTTASGASSAQPGIALWGHSDTLGRHYCVTLYRGALHAVLEHIDVGPAPWTGRKIDVTGAGVARRAEERSSRTLKPMHDSSRAGTGPNGGAGTVRLTAYE